MDLISEPAPYGDPAADLALSHALVRSCAAGLVAPALRIYRPSTPLVVFGRRDTRHPGYPRALEAALDEGFTPAIRATGGRAVAYTTQALVVDMVGRERPSVSGQERRFAQFGHRFADLLRQQGIDARVGAVPGEYCPGAHSINARGTSKLVGTAQRVLRTAWLFSSLVVVGDQEPVRKVLTRVYGALDLPFDPSSVGSLVHENPNLTVRALEEALRSAWAVDRLVASSKDLLRLREELLPDHRC